MGDIDEFGEPRNVESVLLPDDPDYNRARLNIGQLYPGHILFPGFWRHRSEWPHSSSEEIFLGEAVIEVAGRIFGVEWLGDEGLAGIEAAHLPAILAQLESSAEWIANLARIGVFQTTALNPDSGEFVPLGRGIWFDSEAFPKLFWDCRMRTPDQREASWQIFLSQPDFGMAVDSACSQDPSDHVSDRTGGPGRPSSMHLIESMMRKRAGDGRLAQRLHQEALELRAEFMQGPRFQGLRTPTEKAIQNALRDLYRELKGQSEDGPKITT